MTLADFIMQDIEGGQSPFTGSMFPGLITVSPDYLVAGVPNSPPSLDGLPLVAVYDIETGEQLDLFLPGSDPRQGLYIGNFDQGGDLLLSEVLDGSDGVDQSLHDIRLYRLDYP